MSSYPMVIDIMTRVLGLLMFMVGSVFLYFKYHKNSTYMALNPVNK